jgi:methionyl-tRNA formyltransferase
MTRIALLTTECAQLGDALTEIIGRHRDDLALVITSDVYATKRGGLFTQTRRNWRRSGARFVKYLTCSFLAYSAYLTLDRLVAPLRGGRRTRLRAAELCRRYGIGHMHTGNINDPQVVDALRRAEIDVIVIYWFDQILHEEVIAAPRRAIVNVHAAYLPHCRGLFPVLFSALEPGTPFGITAHLIENREIDAGPILAQQTAHPPPGRSVLFYDSWVNRVGVDMLDKVLADLDGHIAAARPQPGGGSYHSYPSRAEVDAAHPRRLPLITLRDFLAVCRGTGATGPTGPTRPVDPERAFAS